MLELIGISPFEALEETSDRCDNDLTFGVYFVENVAYFDSAVELGYLCVDVVDLVHHVSGVGKDDHLRSLKFGVDSK
jgi:hypothetical protein